MSAHTPGNLELEEVVSDGGQIKHLCPIDSDGFSILTVVEHEGVKFAAVYHDDDARRFVAAWNACDGIPTEVLEDIPGVMGASVAYHTIKTQRDELLAALEDMLNGWQYIRRFHGDLYGVGWDRAEGKAVAAIAKVKGEQS